MQSKSRNSTKNVHLTHIMVSFVVCLMSNSRHVVAIHQFLYLPISFMLWSTHLASFNINYDSLFSGDTAKPVIDIKLWCYTMISGNVYKLGTYELTKSVWLFNWKHEIHKHFAVTCWKKNCNLARKVYDQLTLQTNGIFVQFFL